MYTKCPEDIFSHLRFNFLFYQYNCRRHGGLRKILDQLERNSETTKPIKRDPIIHRYQNTGSGTANFPTGPFTTHDQQTGQRTRKIPNF